MKYVCSCGMALQPTDEAPDTSSPRWYAEHRDRRVAAFPDLDAGSVRNLDLLVHWAQERDS